MIAKCESPVTDNKEQAKSYWVSDGCWRIMCNGIGEWGDYIDKAKALAEAARLRNESYVKENGDNITVEWYPYKEGEGNWSDLM